MKIFYIVFTNVDIPCRVFSLFFGVKSNPNSFSIYLNARSIQYYYFFQLYQDLDYSKSGHYCNSSKWNLKLQYNTGVKINVVIWITDTFIFDIDKVQISVICSLFDQRSQKHIHLSLTFVQLKMKILLNSSQMTARQIDQEKYWIY